MYIALPVETIQHCRQQVKNNKTFLNAWNKAS